MKKKLFALLIVLLLSLPLLVSAESSWSYDKSLDVAYLNGEEYTPYQLGVSDGILPLDFNVYKAEYNDEVFYIHQPKNVENIAFLSDYSSYHYESDVYANTEGKKSLDKFFNGEYASYKLFKNSCYYTAGFNSAYVEALDSMTPTKELTVSSLQYLERYDVAGLDETGTIYHIHGAFYKFNQNLYYINYDVLDNSHFDSDGNFSYRSGNVFVVDVPEEIELQVRSAITGIKYKSDSHNQTYDVYNTAEEKFGVTLVFIVSSLMLGYLLPLIPFILSLIFARSKKSLYPKRWYILTLCSAVWMLIFTCIIVLVIIG